jgi:hypothetical protein
MLMARFFIACAAIVLLAAAPLDIAVIYGTRNSHTYEIVVRSDGAASIATGASAPRSFTIPRDTVSRFFAALSASRSDNFTSLPCTKGDGPYYSTIHVSWHGWVSGDVTCPANEPVPSAVALNNTVSAIVVYAGPPAAITKCSEMPPGWAPPGCKG